MPASSVKILFIGYLLIINCSCSSKPDETISAMENSLEESIKRINTSTEQILQSLIDKKFDPTSKARAEFWEPKASVVAIKTKTLYNELDNLKKKERISDSELHDLYNRFTSYKLFIETSDSNIILAMPQLFSSIEEKLKLLNKDTINHQLSFNRSTSPQLKTSIFIMLQNEIKVIENKVVAFCHNQIGSTGRGFYTDAPVVGQNTKSLKEGDFLEIYAGVGAFSRQADPIVNINGKNLEITEYGYAVFKVTINKKPGKYSVPVKITYKDQDGIIQTWFNNVKYEVIKERDSTIKN